MRFAQGSRRGESTPPVARCGTVISADAAVLRAGIRSDLVLDRVLRLVDDLAGPNRDARRMRSRPRGSRHCDVRRRRPARGRPWALRGLRLDDHLLAFGAAPDERRHSTQFVTACELSRIVATGLSLHGHSGLSPASSQRPSRQRGRDASQPAIGDREYRTRPCPARPALG
jgi:hypothetical protein